MRLRLFNTVFAFLKRDIAMEASYKLSFLTEFLGIFFAVLSFYFISRLMGAAAQPLLVQYGGDYFSFVLIGIAFTAYLSTALGTFSGTIRQAQVMGTLESMLVTPTSFTVMLFASSGWSFITTTINVIIHLLFGIFVFGVDLGNADIPAAIAILLLTIVSFGAAGIISACTILLFKRGNIFAWAFSSVSALLCGTLYPITILPAWLQAFSYFLPLTYALHGIRLALLQGYSLGALAGDLLALLAFAVVLVPLSIAVLRFTLRKARLDGSIAGY
ncbi:MAG: ABC transporter permease [Candidatus Diapherotrites archaeon]